jgi:PiT family inorganic phosphate transporter
MSILALAGIGAMALWLSYANGANDNFKGVATLFGSDTTNYRQALVWGTVTTLAGSLFAVLLAGRLVQAFSGKGVVPDALVGDPRFLFSVAAGAATVVMVATLAGLPVSTTHALVGGLAGAGASSAGMFGISWPTLGGAFALPLLVSPALSAALVVVAYPLLRRFRMWLGVRHDSCICMDQEEVSELAPAVGGGVILHAAAGEGAMMLRTEAGGGSRPRVGRADACGLGYEGKVLGITAQNLLDAAHYLSAGAVSFARGLNDTPKIAALLLAGGTIDALWGMVAVGLGMAAGAMLQAYKVGHTMSRRITRMNSGQGFTANAATAFMVLLASRFGVPVSTTHVSTGALFGLGASTRQLDTATFRAILLAWVVTLPAAFATAWLVYRLLP